MHRLDLVPLCSSLLACAGCWSSVEPSRAPDVTVVELAPQDAVALDAPVFLHLSAPIRPPEGRWPIVVMRADGRSTAADVDLTEDGTTIVLRPPLAWPSAEQLEVQIGEGLEGAAGASFAEDAAARLVFSTVALPVRAEFALESPEPGVTTPPNVRRIVLALTGGAEVQAVTLGAAHHTLALPVVARDARGRVVAELPHDAPSLSPATRYRIEVSPLVQPAGVLHQQIVTGTTADRIPPEIRLRDVDRGGSAVRIVVEADEPFLARGSVRAPDGSTVPLRAALVPSARVELWASADLAPETTYQLRVDASDASGNAAAPLEVAFVTPSEVRVELTEVVATPLHDWGDVARGVPFDDSPGRGAVTDADEWIELVNRSDRPVDLTQVALGLRLLDATPVEHDVAAAAQLYFGRGGDLRAWGVGEALVVRPRGALAQRDLTIEVVWGDRVLDRVQLGRDPEADHAGGPPPDLEHEAIAREGAVWRWCAPTPGDPLVGGCVR